MNKKNYFLIFIFSLSLGSVLWLFSDFLQMAIVAWLLVMITQNFAINLEKNLAASKIKLVSSHYEMLSAAILTLILLMILFMPLVYFADYIVSTLTYQKLIAFKTNGINTFTTLTWIPENIKLKIVSSVEDYSKDFTSSDNLKHIWGIMQNHISNFSRWLVHLGSLVVLFFLFHWYRRDILAFFSKLIPLDLPQQKQIYKNVNGAISIVFLTIFAVAIMQGIAFGILMFFFHYDPLMIGIFTALSSVIPVFGTALVWVPIALSEVAHGNLTGGIIIACYGMVVLAFVIDNFVRLIFLKFISKIVQVDYQINEFLLFFAIAAGVASLGFSGILIGPAMIALFIALSNEFFKK